MPNGLTREQLHRLARLGALRRLEELQQERKTIEAMLGGRQVVSTPHKATRRRRRRRRMSAEARAKIAAAQRRRWAAVRATKTR